MTAISLSRFFLCHYTESKSIKTIWSSRIFHAGYVHVVHCDGTRGSVRNKRCTNENFDRINLIKILLFEGIETNLFAHF